MKSKITRFVLLLMLFFAPDAMSHAQERSLLELSPETKGALNELKEAHRALSNLSNVFHSIAEEKNGDRVQPVECPR